MTVAILCGDRANGGGCSGGKWEWLRGGSGL